MCPFTTTDEAWSALVEQRGMCDGEAVDLWEHQLQTAEGLERLGADEELIVAGLLHDQRPYAPGAASRAVPRHAGSRRGQGEWAVGRR